MEFLLLLRREIKEPIRPLLLFLIVSGSINGLLIAIINNAAENVYNAELTGRSFFMFITGVAIFLLAKKYVLDRSTIIVESAINQLRNRIADKIRHTELSTIESIGTSPLYARLTQDAVYISETASIIIGSIQSALMVTFTIIYVGTVSMWSFFLIVITLFLGLVYYHSQSVILMTKWKKVSREETTFFEMLGHILKGFKEIKINRSKNEEVYDNYKIVNRKVRNQKINLGYLYNGLLIFCQILFYILIGGVVYIVPQFHPEHSEDVIKVTAAVFSIMGPFEGIISSIRFVDIAKNSAQNIVSLEEELEEELNKNKLTIESQNMAEAYELLPYTENIQFKDLTYSYPPTKEQEYIFTVGPVNLTFRKGELIFITGGNGSGKSTFLKLLTGLYQPEAGQIIVDVETEGVAKKPVVAQNYQQYRNLFTTIFTDFHLFDKLYGIKDINDDVVNQLLQNMELSQEKTRYRDGGFTNIDLSSGQKKRLALTASLMEDKPIYIFDEVASDLDPEFRDKYYYELILELKERNKTVIVVSHDQHYWTVPDRLLKMTNGSIREFSKEEIDTLLALNKNK